MKDYQITPKHKVIFIDGYTGKEVVQEFPSDSDINDWKYVFKTILVAATFNTNSLKFLDFEDIDE